MNEIASVKPGRGCPSGAATIEQPNGSAIGNPPHEPTDGNRQLVRTLTKFMPHEMIADELGIHYTTLYKYYRDDLSAGKREVIKALGSKAITKAMAGDNQMILAYLRTFGGWNEPHRHEHSGPGGGPIPVAAIHAHMMGKSTDELTAIERFLSELVGSHGGDASGYLVADGSGIAADRAPDIARPQNGGPAG